MPIRLAQRPRNHFIQLFRIHVALLGDLSQDGIDRFALFVLLFALDEVFGRDAAFGQVDVAYFCQSGSAIGGAVGRGMWRGRARWR